MLLSWEPMGLALVLAAVLGSPLDKGFCPAASSPQRHMDNVGVAVKNGQMTDEALSAEVAARLIDTTEAGRTIGWLYIDEHGTDYIVLKPHVRRDVYNAFGMNWFNHYRPDTDTEVMAQLPYLRLPAGVEVRSCTQSDG